MRVAAWPAVWHAYGEALSSRWLYAVPRALGACRFGLWPAAAVILAGFVPASGCTAVKSGTSVETMNPGPEAAGGSSGGLSADAGSACHASDVSTYAPSPYVPAAAPSAVCLGVDGGELWDAFYDACFGPANSKASCDSFTSGASTAACAACILTSYTNERLGPVVNYGDFVDKNVAGCIEVEAPRELPCAKAVQALTGCEIAACQANCPVSDATTLFARKSCAAVADGAGCNSFNAGTEDGGAGVAALSCKATESDAGVAGPCMDETFKQFYEDVVPLFCGRAPVDASAGFDASFGDAALEPVDGGEPGDAGRAVTAADAAAE